MKVFILTSLLAVRCLGQAYSSEAYALGQKMRQPQDKALESLTLSTNRDERFFATWSLRRDREELLAKLMDVLRGPYPERVKADTVAVLGDYRAAEAVPLLVEHLQWDEQREPLSKTMLFSRIPNTALEAFVSPVSVALVKIGMPAIPSLLDKITQTDDARLAGKCISICQSIEGAEVTQFQLQRQLEKETEPKKKERLQAALEALKNIKPEK